MQDYYKILEVSKSASQEEIKQSYRLLAKRWHPDANGNTAESEEKFKAISEAYSILSSPEKREEYDNMFAFQNAKKDDFSSFNNNRQSGNKYSSRDWEFTYTYTTHKNNNKDFSGYAIRTIVKGALQVIIGGLLFTLAGWFPILGIYSVLSGVSNIKKGISHL